MSDLGAIGRAVMHQLESLQRAGVTHLRRPPQVAAPSPTPVSPAPAMRPTAAHAVVRPPAPSDATPPNKPAGQARGATSQAAGIPARQGGATIPAAEDDSPRGVALGAIRKKVAACMRCAELCTTRKQTVFGVGNTTPRLVFLGEAPGADEDAQGIPFVGAAGKLLTDIIEKGMGLRREDVYILNILKCRPPGNRTPLPVEAAACREYLDGQLAILQPEFICCLGACAAQNLLATTRPIGQFRGKFFEYQTARVLCTYHPAYLLRNPAAKKQVWEDIQLLMAEMGLERKPPQSNA